MTGELTLPGRPLPQVQPGSGTRALTTSGRLASLTPEQRRVVALACSFHGASAPATLGLLVDPAPASAAKTLAALPRTERLALFARLLASPGEAQLTPALVLRLESDRPWLSALAAPYLSAPASVALLSVPVVREVSRRRPHPALAALARRLAARFAGDRPSSIKRQGACRQRSDFVVVPRTCASSWVARRL